MLSSSLSDTRTSDPSLLNLIALLIKLRITAVSYTHLDVYKRQAFTRAGKNLIIWSKKGQKGTMSELLANTLPVVALKEGIDWEEDCYEQGELCPSKEEKAKTSTNKLTQKPNKLPVRMESMRHEIEFRQSNRSADFIQGIEEEESDDRFINRGRMLHTLFSAIETAEDIDPAIERLIFEGVIASSEKAEEIREVARKAFSSPEIQDWYSGEDVYKRQVF